MIVQPLYGVYGGSGKYDIQQIVAKLNELIAAHNKLVEATKKETNK